MIEPSPKDKARQDQLKLSGDIPKHIAIIMDGNGRWAKERGLSRVFGHRQGVTSVRDVVEACGQLGVKILTLYTFSTENWKRPRTEIALLMKLLISSIRTETDKLMENDVKLIASGNLENLPAYVHAELSDSIERTKSNKGLILNLALSYSGRWDILNAVHKIVLEQKAGKFDLSTLNEQEFENYLATAGLPNPDLMIRTGGDFRISNFLLWQIAYSEIVISKTYWPDFRRGNLYKAIAEFQNRERRFGMTSEQIKKKHKV